jgi:hypothetical protein
MRRATIPALLAPAVLLAGCLTTPAKTPDRVQTTSQANRESVRGAAEAPLRDVNLLRTKIPEVLLYAEADPYNRPPKGWKCQDLIAMVQTLNDALGDDLDAPSQQPGMKDKGKSSVLGLAAGAASDMIPFRSWVRKLSGAERHDDLVQRAITAGAVRRAYLKGLGEARGCNPPATPSHILAGSEVPSQAIKPRYPIKTPDVP